MLFRERPSSSKLLFPLRLSAKAWPSRGDSIEVDSLFYGQGTGTDPGEIYSRGLSQTNIKWMGITWKPFTDSLAKKACLISNCSTRICLRVTKESVCWALFFGFVKGLLQGELVRLLNLQYLNCAVAQLLTRPCQTTPYESSIIIGPRTCSKYVKSLCSSHVTKEGVTMCEV